MTQDNGNGLDVKSNGHDPEVSEAELKKLKGFLNAGDFEGAFQSSGVPSAIEKFVERGETFADLSMRADFRGDRHVNNLVLLYADAVHFEHKELQEAIINVVAARTSINAKRIETLLKAVVGQLEQEKSKSAGSRLRSMVFGDKKEGQQQ